MSLILSVETSCDDTSIAIFENEKLLTQFTLSSVLEQRKYGGVVPEVASREHLNSIHKCLINCLNKINISIFDINYIIYTEYPGLPGSLHIGILFAKMLANLINKKAIGINHLCGHIFSAFINNNKEEITYPFLSLVVSGGNSIIYKVDSPVKYSILNNTVDDAIGEVYDKVARALNWSYPGGPIIDKNYNETKSTISFIKKWPEQSASFSFSGLKTAVLNYINTKKMKNEVIDEIEIASSFQKTAIELIIDKLQFYKSVYNINCLVLGGGVSANNLLRQSCKKITNKLYIPEIKYTGDNAAMIGYYGYLLLAYNNKN